MEGDRAYAFNRRAFELEMQRLQSVHSEQSVQNSSEPAPEPISKSSDSQVAA